MFLINNKVKDNKVIYSDLASAFGLRRLCQMYDWLNKDLNEFLKEL